MYVSLINAIICSLFLIELEIIRCFVAGNYTRGLFFIKIMSCACAGGICTRATRGARVFIKLAEKREKRKNKSGEHAGNRLGESAGDARESKRNDWTDNHAKARAGKWLKRE